MQINVSENRGLLFPSDPEVVLHSYSMNHTCESGCKGCVESNS